MMISRKAEKNLIVGLDIGTSNVIAIVGEVNQNSVIEVVGIGSHPSKGLKKGIVVNIESTVQSIQHVIEAAEQMAGCRIHSVYTGISGSHIRSLNSHGVTAIKHREVKQEDVARVMEAARVVAIPAEKKILHILPQEFIVDNHEGIYDPVGMAGVRLEARVHIVTCAVSAAQNVVKCVQRCGLEVDDIILQQLASSRAVLTQDEKELGVCLIDIGGGTTDLAIFTHGAIKHAAVIPIAGDQVTSDIAVAFRMPTQSAEEIKINRACCLKQFAQQDERIDVTSIGDRTARILSRYALAEVVEPRCEELFEFAQAEIQRSGLEKSITAGIVLTGGSSKMDGIVELAEEILNLPVRLGYPNDVVGLQDILCSPIYATAVGLLLFGNENRLVSGPSPISRAGSGSLWTKMKSWVQGNF
jgi:cell division protein FtsA